MIKEQEIQKLITDFIQGTDKFVVDVKVSSNNKIIVELDSDSGVNIDDCVQLNRYLERSLDRDKEDFELKVSSPGMDQPFKVLRQYKKSIGRKIRVVTSEGKELKGILIKADDRQIDVELSKEDNKQVSLHFDQIKTTRKVISFNK